MYQVIKCGSFGHNIRCGPSLKSTPVGMLTMEDKVLGMIDVSTFLLYFQLLVIFPLISPSDVVGINELTDSEN
jgi:hypothetical protein